jgi:hypothetical protein
VICVLAAVGFAAAFSTSTGFARQGGGDLPLPNKPCLDRADAVSLAGNAADPSAGGCGRRT